MVRATSTIEELLEEQRDVDGELRRLRRMRRTRRVVLALLALIVAGAVAGLFGERTRTGRASGAGYTLEIRYPYVVRDGPPASVTVTVRHPSGFTDPVEIVFDGSYLSALEQADLSPQPDSERSAGDDVVWSFAPPDGDSLVVHLAAQLSSRAHFAQHGRVGVRDHGKTEAEVAFTTWVWP